MPADELGFTLIYEHIFLDLRNDLWLSGRILNDQELAYQALMLYKQAGGMTVVDQTSRGLRGNRDRILPTKHPQRSARWRTETDSRSSWTADGIGNRTTNPASGTSAPIRL